MIGSRIKELRKSLNLNQKDFGEKIGITNTAISKIESCERNVTDQVILSICRAFRVNKNWLKNGDGEMFNRENVDEELMLAFGQLAVTDNYKLKEALLTLSKLTDEQIIYLADMVKKLRA